MTTSLIVLSDKETATLTDDTGNTTVPLSAIAASDSKYTLLPANCRIHISNGLTNVFVIEHQPCIREVNWRPNPEEWKNLISRGAKSFGQVEGNDTRTNFLLAFPYTVFIVCVERTELKCLRVYFRNHSIVSAEDYLQQAGLIPEDTLVVTDQTLLRHHGMTPASTAEVAVEYFWHQTLGTGNPIGTVHPNVPEVASVWEWEYASRKPQEWILKSKWAGDKFTLQAAARAMLQRPATQDGVDPIYSAIVTRVRQHTSNKRVAHSNELVESPRVALTLGTTRVRQGDVLVSRKRLFGCKKGGKHMVLGLYERTSKGLIHAKLEGVSAPVPIGTVSGLVDFKLFKPERTVANEIVCDGVTFNKGTRFCVSSSEDISRLEKDREYEIVELEVDPEGDARVRVYGISTRIYITYDGGKLLPSVYQNIPSLKDNTFTCGPKRISVGMFVRITEGAEQIRDTLFRVASVAQNGETYTAVFEGHKKQITLCEDGELKLAWEVVTYEFSDKRVALGDEVLDLTDSKFLLVTISENPKENGKLYKIEGFVHATGGHRLDVDLIYNKGRIPVIRLSKWVFSCEFEQVSDRYENGALTLQSGEVFVCENAIDNLTIREELTILCFGKNKENPKLTDVIFSDGRSIVLTQVSFKLFSRKEGKPWSEKELAKLEPGVDPKARAQIDDRVRVIYESRIAIGQVIKKDCDDRYVRFDNPQPDGSNPTLRDDWFHHSKLEHLDTIKVSWRFYKGQCVWKRQNGTLVKISMELQKEHQSLKRTETKLMDLFGNALSVGDIVIPTHRGFTRECPQKVIGTPMLIVHFSRNNYDVHFLYLWAGSEHKPNAISSDARDFSSITEEFRNRRDELYANTPGSCEKLTLVQD